jgi:N-acetylglucosamine kinase-like BadF-type ATPase
VIVKNIRPGGFILGDEGSGAALGKAFVSDFIKGLLPDNVEEEFVKEYGLDYQKIVQKVYREPAASAFLASFAPFILERTEEPYIKNLLDSVIESFVVRSLKRYGQTVKVGVVGSFGCACEAVLRETGIRHGLEFTMFLKSPIDKLTEYHMKF